MLLSSAALCAISNPDLDIVIKECEGSYESKVACNRTLGDGTTQTGSGWCKCSGGKLSGGCNLPAATYTEKRVNLKGEECRTCTVPAVTKGCGGISQIVDETPTCGDWRFCVGDIVIDPEEPIVKECTSGQVQYKPKGHSKYSCINAQLPTCNEKNVGHYYEIWVNEYSDVVNGANPCNGETRGYCKEMLCAQ